MIKRGTAGEASIFKDPDGRWHGWITVGTKPNGKPDRRHRTAKTRAEVVKKIRELEVQPRDRHHHRRQRRHRRGLARARADEHRSPTCSGSGRWRAMSRPFACTSSRTSAGSD